MPGDVAQHDRAVVLFGDQREVGIGAGGRTAVQHPPRVSLAGPSLGFAGAVKYAVSIPPAFLLRAEHEPLPPWLLLRHFAALISR
jgi:hypothetical protein